jgi:hypothetical protein
LPDFSKHQIIWGGGHGLDRSAERDKPPDEVEAVIHTSTYQTDKGNNRWEILGCIGGFMSRVFVQDIGKGQLIVVSVYGEDQKCK